MVFPLHVQSNLDYGGRNIQLCSVIIVMAFLQKSVMLEAVSFVVLLNYINVVICIFFMQEFISFISILDPRQNP